MVSSQTVTYQAITSSYSKKILGFGKIDQSTNKWTAMLSTKNDPLPMPGLEVHIDNVCKEYHTFPG